MSKFFWRTSLILSGLLLSLAAQGVTPEVGKDALRNLVKLPTISFQPDWSFDPERGFTLGSSEQNTTHQITTLSAQLNHNRSDAENLLQLGELYLSLNDPASAALAWSRSADFFRERLELQPTDGLLLAGLGQALQGWGKNQEAESVLRRAVLTAPAEWRCRVALGRLLDAEARQDILDHPQTDADTGADQLDSGKVSLAQRRLSEAGECFDRAAALAPDEAEVYFRRGMHRCLRNVVLDQISIASGEQKEAADWLKSSFSPESLADLQHASQLSPKDYALIGGAVLFEIYPACARNRQADWADFSWTSLSDKSQRSIREAMTRLETLGQDSDPQLAAGALETLAILQGPILHEQRSCITSLRRAIALDPDREQAWELLTATLAHTGAYDDLLAVCEDRVRQKDSARGHLLLAKADEKVKQWDDAEEETLEAVRLAPNNFAANLAVGALLLKRSQDASVLTDADGWLARAEHILSETPAAQRDQRQVIDLTLTRSIYFALTDELDAARQWARAVINKDKDNHLAQDILSAMDY